MSEDPVGRPTEKGNGLDAGGVAARRVRADARRNIDALLEAAKAVFAESGVDVPVRDIAARAEVGVGTVYRHFPRRSDLVAAVFRREVDACADDAPLLAAEYEPGEALERWIHRYAAFIGAKRGLAAALHSGDSAFDELPAYFDSRFRPALQSLLESAVGAGEIRSIPPEDLLRAVANLCIAPRGGGAGNAPDMIELLMDGLRYGASSSGTRVPGANR